MPARPLRAPDPDDDGRQRLHPMLRDLASIWPILAGAGALAVAAIHAEAQIGEHDRKLDEHGRRLDRLEQTYPLMADRLARIEQQGRDAIDRLDRIERRQDQENPK